jgi:hypothetical protein
MSQEDTAMCRRRLIVCSRLSVIIALPFLLSTGLLSAQDQQERDRLSERIDRVIEQERSASIIDYADSRKFAGDLKSLESDVKGYQARLEQLDTAKRDGLKLNGTRVNMLLRRVEDWNKDSVWPMMDVSANSSNRDWLTRERIRGQRILVRRSESVPWRYRILVAKNTRDESRMTSWLKAEATNLSDQAWKQKYPGADQAKAKQDGKLSDWAIHHQIPLYVGDANGGRDEPSNYILLPASRHRDIHSSSGETYREWGPTTLYVVRGGEYDEVTSTGDD